MGQKSTSFNDRLMYSRSLHGVSEITGSVCRDNVCYPGENSTTGMVGPLELRLDKSDALSRTRLYGSMQIDAYIRIACVQTGG